MICKLTALKSNTKNRRRSWRCNAKTVGCARWRSIRIADIQPIKTSHKFISDVKRDSSRPRPKHTEAYQFGYHSMLMIMRTVDNACNAGLEVGRFGTVCHTGTSVATTSKLYLYFFSEK